VASSSGGLLRTSPPGSVRDALCHQRLPRTQLRRAQFTEQTICVTTVAQHKGLTCFREQPHLRDRAAQEVLGCPRHLSGPGLGFYNYVQHPLAGAFACAPSP
jgi:hypothetical protein